MALPILLDCDPGHDDAIAIVLALASPELDVKAITSSAGNQTPEKTLRNVLRMLTLLNRTDIPVAGGAVKPLMRELIIADNVHGESGLDGPALPEPTFAPQNCTAEHKSTLKTPSVSARLATLFQPLLPNCWISSSNIIKTKNGALSVHRCMTHAPSPGC